ncbi:PDZ domain-containing protein [Aliikangiella marina]|nr:PDZ domain-containing protein [Aliikangiella marina]
MGWRITSLILIVSLLGMMMPSAEASASLKRKGILGLMPVDRSGPLLVAQILPGSTAETIGLKVGDSIQTLNNQTVGSFDDLIPLLANLYAGDHIALEVTREKKKLKLSGLMQERQREQSQHANIEYRSVDYANNRLRSILHLPKQSIHSTQDGVPAIYFIQGYTCDSIDYGLIPNVTTRQMIDQFVIAGYAVFRVEKLGVGDSRSSQHCRDVDFNTELTGFVAGLDALKSHHAIDPAKVYLWGHSLGVLYAPAMASQQNVAGIIGYGGVAKPWYDYMVDLFAKQSTKFWGLSQEQAERNTQMIKPMLADWLKSNKDWHTITQSKSFKESTRAELLAVNGDYVLTRHYEFFRSINQQDFQSMWLNIKVPTLMMHGSLDIQAISEDWAFQIARWVNQNSEQKIAKAIVIDGAEHGFMRYKNREALMQASREGRPSAVNPGKHFDKRIGELTINWLKEVTQ